MQKTVIFSLLLLVLVAFFSGLNLGKKIQSVDTPVKTVVTKIVVTRVYTPTVTLKLTATKSASPSARITP